MKEVIRIFILCIIIQFTLANNEIYTSLFGLEVTQSQIDSDPAYSCSVPNDCIYAPGRPYCINGICRQCNPAAGERASSCECLAGQYCIKYPSDPNYGFCREYESNIVDRNCDIRLTNGMDTIQGANDTVFCGKVIYGSDLKPIFVEWTGSCQVGVCKQCNNPFIPTVPLSLCNDGRSCLNGYEIYAMVGAFSLSYITQSPLFTAYYIAIIEVGVSGVVILSTFFGYYYYYRLGKRNIEKNVKQHNNKLIIN